VAIFDCILIVMLADWLQGTNMYTLYQSYGVNIGALFITGFMSSAIFGTFLGLFVDKFGRKKACILFCLLEIAINVLEHFPNMYLLLLGRVMGGLSTSLLFSAFESWMVSQHRKKGYPEEWLTKTFGLASMGNGLIAILAGVLAQVAADKLGDIGPFQAAIALTGLALCLLFRWEENYGGHDHSPGMSDDAPEDVGLLDELKTAWACIREHPTISLLGFVQAFFEGGMYTFVFMWVPTLLALVPNGDLPTGLVFSSFMVCITIGGMMFESMVKITSVERGSLWVFVAATLSMVIPAFFHQLYPVLASFLVFETCVGAFFACSGTMRSKYFPDSLQSSIMNIFRLPLNLMVVIGTKLTDSAPSHVVFLVCASWFAICAILQMVLCSASMRQAKNENPDSKCPLAQKPLRDKKLN